MRITIKQTNQIKQLKNLIFFFDYYKPKYSYEDMMKQYVLDQMTDIYNNGITDHHIMCKTDGETIIITILDKKTKQAEEYRIDEFLYNDLMK